MEPKTTSLQQDTPTTQPQVRIGRHMHMLSNLNLQRSFSHIIRHTDFCSRVHVLLLTMYE